MNHSSPTEDIDVFEAELNLAVAVSAGICRSNINPDNIVLWPGLDADIQRCVARVLRSVGGIFDRGAEGIGWDREVGYDGPNWAQGAMLQLGWRAESNSLNLQTLSTVLVRTAPDLGSSHKRLCTMAVGDSVITGLPRKDCLPHIVAARFEAPRRQWRWIECHQKVNRIVRIPDITDWIPEDGDPS